MKVDHVLVDDLVIYIGLSSWLFYSVWC